MLGQSRVLSLVTPGTGPCGQGTLTSAGAPARANHRPHSRAAPVYFNFLSIDPGQGLELGEGDGIDQLMWGGQSVWSAGEDLPGGEGWQVRGLRLHQNTGHNIKYPWPLHTI